MKVLHLLYAGGTGGIEKLCKDIGQKSQQGENIFWFVHAGGNICDEMRDEKLEVIETRYENKDILALYRQIKEVVGKRGIDVIVLHHPAPLVWFAVLCYLKQKRRASVMVYAHNSYEEITKRSKWKVWVYNKLLQKCDLVIAISEYVKSTFAHVNGLPSEKIAVVYNGVATDMYHTARMGIHEGAPALLYVGRLIPQKGVDYLLRAVSVMEHRKEISLTIVGDGSERENLEKLTKDLKLEQQVHFEGIQRNVADYLAASDVFVHPAIWEEGFGITVVEAMSAGLICVTFAKGALPEIIQDGQNGFIITEVTATALAQKLDVICREMARDNMLSLRENAVSRAEYFTIEKLLEELRILYDRVTKKNSDEG